MHANCTQIARLHQRRMQHWRWSALEEPLEETWGEVMKLLKKDGSEILEFKKSFDLEVIRRVEEV